MRPEDKDIFTLVHDMLFAMERGEYEVGEAQDYPGDDKTASLLTSQGFATQDPRIMAPAAFLSTILLDQVPPGERNRIDFKNALPPSLRGSVPQAYHSRSRATARAAAFSSRCPMISR